MEATAYKRQVLEIEAIVTDQQKILWSTKFSAGWSLLPAYNFLATIASIFSTYHLGAMAP